ncbi:hypothetical protein C8R44DRAFT_808367 [Mycena epipterygia]|nr:hypothetical protein C8R44DRAFT_808367 [Mycena epipterygia]
MFRLGDIAKHKGDLIKAKELWQEARPLFERSSQAKDMAQIDARLALMSDTQETSLAFLSELEAPNISLDELSTVKEIASGS